MAKITTLANSHHVVRFVPYARCEKDDSGEPIGFLPQAFALRVEGDGTLEEYLSAAWVEFFHDARHEDRVNSTIVAFVAQPKPRVGAKARFAMGNVGRIREACKQYGQTVRISHEPVEDFDFHASVRQFTNASDELLDLLASEAWAQMHSPIVP